MGIPIDFVGGTSICAFIGALWSSSQDIEEVTGKTNSWFQVWFGIFCLNFTILIFFFHRKWINDGNTCWIFVLLIPLFKLEGFSIKRFEKFSGRTLKSKIYYCRITILLRILHQAKKKSTEMVRSKISGQKATTILVFN